MSQAQPLGPRPDVVDDWLQATPCRIGQILIERDVVGGFCLRHREDAACDDLEEFRDAEDADEIARYDDKGVYRPLKTAPNLRRGWLLILQNLAAARRALDYFYPARLAIYEAWRADALDTTTLRETLGRQSGMYRVAARISDAAADELVASFCRSDGGCLRTILWQKDASGAAASSFMPAEKFDPAFDQTGRAERTLPLLCQEACNLLVAEARKVVKVSEK